MKNIKRWVLVASAVLTLGASSCSKWTDLKPATPTDLSGNITTESASKRNTKIGVVLEARIRPKPSGNSTRRPSMVMISVAPSNLALAGSPDGLGKVLR